MQTYTHTAVGAALASALYPDDHLIQAVIVAGSVAPDLVMIPSFVVSKLRGEQAMKKQGAGTIVLKEMSHSLPLSLCLITLFFFLPFAVLGANFFLAMCVHILIDILTHCGSKFQDTDQSCVWPLEKHLPKLGSIFGLWEYRYDHGVLKPKPFELGIFIASIGIWFYNVIL